MSGKPLEVLIVGAGRIGELHARNIRSSIPSLEVCALVEPKPSESVADWSAGCDIPIVADMDTALERFKPDAALIAVPTNLHEKAAVRALDAGLHVFCEKPVAPDIPAARRVVQTAEDRGRIFQVGFNRRFDRNFSALASAVEGGEIGRTEMVRITSRDPGPPPMDYIVRSGGLFMDMSIHDFDMVRYLTGDDFAEVYVTGASLVDPAIGKAGDIDSAVISFRLEGGAIGMIENSRRAAYGYDQRAEILGSNGAASIENERMSTVQKSTRESVAIEKPLYFFLERYGESFITELRGFADAITNNAYVLVDGSDGIEAMRVAQACQLSMTEGRPVVMNEIT